MLREAEQRAVGDPARSIATCSTSLVQLLIAKETVDGSEVYALAGRQEPAGTGVTMAPNRTVSVDKAVSVDEHPPSVKTAAES